MKARRLWPVPVLLLLSGPAFGAGSATLLRDVQPTGVSEHEQAGVAGDLLSLGRIALLQIREPGSGTELWASDGTDAGTRLLLDFCPGTCSSNVWPFGRAGSAGLFVMNSDLDRDTALLWRSDGTRPGTYPLAGPDGPLQPCSLSAVASTGTTLFFTGPAGDGCGLWKSDGTSAGTLPLRQLVSDEYDSLGAMVAVGQRVFFVVSTYDEAQGILASALWVSDGTAGGTLRLREWTSFHNSFTLTAAGSRLFFIAPDSTPQGEGDELWTSDGTPAGTQPLTRFTPASPFVPRSQSGSAWTVQAVDNQLCFLADDGVTGRELWCSDGTRAGTRRATDFPVVSPFLALERWRVEKLGQRLVFPANDGTSGHRLWTTAGQPGSTALLTSCPGGCPEMAPLREELFRVGSRVVFQGSRDSSELWASDGTGPGTRRLHRVCRDGCSISSRRPLLGKLFFTVRDTSGEASFWATDGSEQGTRKLTDMGYISGEGIPRRPAAVGDRGLFPLAGGSSEGSQLWASDGTPEGTAQVTRIGRNGWTSEPRELVPTRSGGLRFLASAGGDRGLWTSQGTEETTLPVAPGFQVDFLVDFGDLTLGWGYDVLWRSDGTPGGTFPLMPLGYGNVESVVSLQSRAVFVVRRFEAPFHEVWSTDGTVAGTLKIFDMPAEFSFLHSLKALDGRAFFVTTRSNHEDQLWETDGTAAGTRRLTAREPLFISDPLRLVRLGTTVYFVGADDNQGDELWRADGTPGGTRAIAEDKAHGYGEIGAHQGHVYFIATAKEAPYSRGLWKSDGTDAGTVLLSALPSPEITVTRPWKPASLGPFLYFVHGTDLWRTNGTAEGTLPVFAAGSTGTAPLPGDLTALGGKLYFTAADQDHGRELWETDGAVLRPVQDVAPGPLSSHPEELVVSGGRLFFTADDGVHGREPWVYVPAGNGCAPSEHAICLGGRFRVEADWRDFTGGNGRGTAVALTGDTGYFWFFDAANVEVILKVLDGQGLNGHHWVFYGALSSVEYTLTVTDTQTGAVRRYINPPGVLGSVADTQAFGPLGAHLPGVVTTGPTPTGSDGEPRMGMRKAVAEGSCAPSVTRLCLNDGRFAVEARWKDFAGNTGTGKAVALGGGDTGYFWFFDEDNVEVVLKVLDGRPLNGKYWVFYGALSSVEYTLTVTDTLTGTVKTYTNPSGRLASVADTGAF